MKRFLKKLLLGKITAIDRPKMGVNPIQKRILNIRAIWNNDHQEDSGIEKVFRLFLAISQLVFPGVYIKYLFFRKGFEYQDISMDIYVTFKVVFPLLTLIYGWQHHVFLIIFIIYLLIETILYIPTLIFASDLLTRPRSYKRSMLLLFFNYTEILLAFAVLYSTGDYLNQPFNHWFDAVYFSVITANSIGYGDYYPVTLIGKVLVSLQAMFFLLFIVLFLNFFSTKINIDKGYFGRE